MLANPISKEDNIDNLDNIEHWETYRDVARNISTNKTTQFLK